MITPELLQKRIDTFWGYGSLQAPVWLIGMEEGFRSSGNHADDLRMLERQFLLPVIDGMFDASRPISDDISDLTNLSPFLPEASIQRTWQFPVSLYLFLKNGRKPDESEILDFQHFILADGKKNEVATFELMPFPAPKISDWLFGDILGFESRNTLRFYRKQRAERLKKLVEKYSPKLVIFYSLGYLRSGEWETVIGKRFEEITKQMYFAKTEKTSFCVIPQPRYLPRAYERIYEFAEKIKTIDADL